MNIKNLQKYLSDLHKSNKDIISLISETNDLIKAKTNKLSIYNILNLDRNELKYLIGGLICQCICLADIIGLDTEDCVKTYLDG